MTRWQRIRKAAALISAVVLVAAFVLYRAGFGDSYMSGSKSSFVFVGSTVKQPDAPGEKPTGANVAEWGARLNPFTPPGE